MDTDSGFGDGEGWYGESPDLDPPGVPVSRGTGEGPHIATVALAFALAELERFPGLPGIPFHCIDLDGKPMAVREQQVERVFEALRRHAITVWPEAQRAMMAYHAIDVVRDELKLAREANAALTAEVERLRGVVAEACDDWEALDRYAASAVDDEYIGDGERIAAIRAALTPPAPTTEEG